MKLAEPTTAITDALLAAETFTLSILLFRTFGAGRQLATVLWAAAFLATAIAALTGGLFHGFVEFPQTARNALWKCALYGIGIASLAFFAGAVVARCSGKVRAVLLVLAAIQFLVYAAWMIRHDDFKYAIYDYAPAMIGILILQLASYNSAGGSRWIVAGILLSFVAAGIQKSGIRLHKHFNFNDLYHVIQMGAMYLLYRGGALLQDR